MAWDERLRCNASAPPAEGPVRMARALSGGRAEVVEARLGPAVCGVAYCNWIAGFHEAGIDISLPVARRRLVDLADRTFADL